MATLAPTAAPAALSGDEMARFRRDGYLGPYTLCSPAEMADLRPAIEQVLEIEPAHGNRVHNRHLDSRAVYDLATRPEIVERMACLYGPDLLLWRTNFFVKNRGSKAIPWQVLEYDSEDHTLQLIHGSDTMGCNRLAPLPARPA